MKYVVCVDDVEIRAFDNRQDAEDFRMSVGGTVKGVEVVEQDGNNSTSKRATQ
jgi:hypothetical protein